MWDFYPAKLSRKWFEYLTGWVYEVFLLYYRPGCASKDCSLSKSCTSLWLNVELLHSQPKAHFVGAGGRRHRRRHYKTTYGGGEELGAWLNECAETGLINQRPGGTKEREERRERERGGVLFFVAAQCLLAEQSELSKMKIASYLYTWVISGRAEQGVSGPAQTASQRSGAVATRSMAQ